MRLSSISRCVLAALLFTFLSCGCGGNSDISDFTSNDKKNWDELCPDGVMMIDFPCNKEFECKSATEYWLSDTVWCDEVAPLYGYSPECCGGGSCDWIGERTCPDGYICKRNGGYFGEDDECVELPECFSGADCSDLREWSPCITPICVNGRCTFVDRDCDDGIECTDDYCDFDDGGCRWRWNSEVPCQSCVSHEDCTSSVPWSIAYCETCPSYYPHECPASGNICFRSIVDCDDFNPCTEDYHVSSICYHDTVVCNDGLPCTDDGCNGETGECMFRWNSSGSCKACEADVDCDTDDPCYQTACVPCPTQAPPVLDKFDCPPSGKVCLKKPCDGCDDFNPCTNDSCDATGNVHHDEVDCDDEDPCTKDFCWKENGWCQHTTIPDCP